MGHNVKGRVFATGHHGQGKSMLWVIMVKVGIYYMGHNGQGRCMLWVIMVKV